MNAESPSGLSYARLSAGDPVPWIRQRTRDKPKFAVDTFAGRYLVLCFFGSAAEPRGRAAIDAALRHRNRFDDERASFFGLSIDPADETEDRVRDYDPGIRFLFDFDRSVSRMCGVAPREDSGGPVQLRRCWMIVDPTLHVLATFPISAGDGDEAVFAFLDRLPDPARYGGLEIPAPVLLLPNVFEPELCRRLIDLYEASGGVATGVVRRGANVVDRRFKRRSDYKITDDRLIKEINERMRKRVIPEIRKLFFMQITRMERYIIGCYAAEESGHFSPHRDNEGGPTAHRRYAVSVNLNGDFEGGEVRFPEYNPRGYKAPPGWAVVFPCAILHAVARVTKGKRYAFLPFMYDEGGKRIREEMRRAAGGADDENPSALDG
jgi:peroxiredoxin/predicted 2-oxoglutarate/Fe(II)-dependent dioxygenase YbiX